MLPLPRRSAADDQDQSIFEIERPRHRYLKAEEEKKLEATSEPDLIDMWKFDLETGFRESNLCDARWSWFDPDEDEHGTIIVDDGSSPLPHTVMLSREAREILDRRRGINDEFIFTLPCRTSGWFDDVLRKKGTHIPVSRTLLYDRMSEAWTAAGISNLIIHDFRRTAARRIMSPRTSTRRRSSWVTAIPRPPMTISASDRKTSARRSRAAASVSAPEGEADAAYRPRLGALRKFPTAL